MSPTVNFLLPKVWTRLWLVVCISFAVLCSVWLMPGVAYATDYPVTNTNDSGPNSLRAAILAANGNPGADSISFAIAGAGVKTITLVDALPDITQPLVIDGLSQGAATCNSWPPTLLVEIDHDGEDGIVVDTENVVIAGLIINRFSGHGIDVVGNSNTITCNFIGVSADGLTGDATGANGVLLRGEENYVGPSTLLQTEGNLIAGFGFGGVRLLGGGNNTVQGNYIGVDVTLLADIGSYSAGVMVGSDNNLIGGTQPGQGNLLAGNTVGIDITDAASNTVQGNYIGLALDGETVIGNDEFGIHMAIATNTLIGGSGAGAGNIISGNGEYGIYLEDSQFGSNSNNFIQGNIIGTNASGTSAKGNQRSGIYVRDGSELLIGGTASGAGNLISGNNGAGIITGFAANTATIQGNRIGTNAAGNAAIPNAWQGVSIVDSGNIVVGGTEAGAGNLISGNGADGLVLTETDGVVVQGNRIGTNIDGTGAIPNGDSGIFLQTAINSLIGGNSAAARNLVSGNEVHGIYLYQHLLLQPNNSDQGPSVYNDIQGNYIGTTIDGESALGNREFGIAIFESMTNTVGGANAGEGNLVSGNGLGGIAIWARDPNFSDSTDNAILGNLIGTDKDGLTAVPNIGHGVIITGLAFNNRVGDVAAGAGNLISGNTQHGVYITGTEAENNMIYGNRIGTTADSLGELGNGGDGAHLINSAPNHVGGVDPAMGNTIAYNGGNGVAIITQFSLGSSRKAILGNSIHDNGALGIDLVHVEDNALVFGVTPNDVGDGDDGPNLRQNYPELSVAQNQDGQLAIEGTLSSANNTSYRLEFFAQNLCDASGFGEGELFLGVASVTTGGDGTAAISVTLPLTQPVGTILTATATDPENNTSEFSACLASINAVPDATDDVANTETSVPVDIDVLANDVDSDGDTLTITLVSDPANGDVVINGGLNVTYTPSPGFEGVDTFTYTISDGQGGTDTAQVTVTIAAPTALPETEQPQQRENNLFLPGVEK